MNDVSEKQRQEQLDVVLRLNKLTKRGKLDWKRVQLVGEPGSNARAAHVADWKGYRVIVEEAPSSAHAGIGARALLDRKSTYRLRVRSRQADPENEDRIIIPPMPAIDDLVSTIRRVNDDPDRVKGDLNELRSFKKHLEEKL